MHKPPLILIPTYNEANNVNHLITKLLALEKKVDILFVDDNSPDGTGKILNKLSKKYINLHIIHRTKKSGIGSAHQEGIAWAYKNNYITLITMDCDFTHRPENINQFLNTSNKYVCVLGSRYLQNNSLPNWHIHRKILTQIGHTMTRLLLGITQDATGAFRLYRLDRIPHEVFKKVKSAGYSFFFESLYLLHVNGFKIGELPISLPARTYGNSKMNFQEIFQSVKLLLKIFINSIFTPEKYHLDPNLLPENIDHTKQDKQGWEDYWAVIKPNNKLIYSFLASCYRKLLIKPSLTHFVKKYFPPDAEVLHAGCGSGQVDVDVRNYISITGLDISLNALQFYRKTNRYFCKTMHGSILDIPLPKNSVDGVYNLGVLEHFSKSDINKIISEFYRVLKPGGKLITFWPPEFGSSVTFFKILIWFSKTILRKKNVKFHPDEISRLKSREQGEKNMLNNKFLFLEYYFGPRDFFTQAVLVAQKPVSKTI